MDATETVPPPPLNKFSPRPTWPKTSEERAVAKALIQQAYERCHSDEGKILWKDLQEKHFDLYDQIMYWAADEMQRVHVLTNTMREDNELPATTGRVTERKKVPGNGRLVDPKFAEVDLFISQHHEKFPSDFRGVQWNIIFDKFPAFHAKCEAVWGTEWKSLRMGVAARHRKIIKGNLATVAKPRKTTSGRVAPPIGQEKDEITSLIFQAAELCRNAKGFVSLKTLKEKQPAIWHRLVELLPHRPLKRIRQRITYMYKTGELSRKGGGAVVSQSAKTRQVASPAEAKPAEELHQLANFRLNYCPICRLNIRDVEMDVNTRLSECPRCHFDLANAEQAYIAKKMIAPSI